MHRSLLHQRLLRPLRPVPDGLFVTAVRTIQKAGRKLLLARSAKNHGSGATNLEGHDALDFVERRQPVPYVVQRKILHELQAVLPGQRTDVLVAPVRIAARIGSSITSIS